MTDRSDTIPRQPVQVQPGKQPGTFDSEAVLVAALKSGDSAAFEFLVRENSPRLLMVARRFLPIEADAMDALQDAFLSAFKAMPGFDSNSKLSTWLHRIVVNACLMKLRSRSRRPETQLDALLPVLEPKHTYASHEDSSALSETAERALHRRETKELVRSTIAELPDAYRAVLLLRDIEEFDTQQVALMLEITEGAVKTRLHRARLALRELLLERLGSDSPFAQERKLES